MNDKDIQECARDLTGTSVDDLQSSLYFYDGASPADMQIIEHALKICTRRGEKTKERLLKSKLNKLKKRHASQKDGV